MGEVGDCNKPVISGRYHHRNYVETSVFTMHTNQLHHSLKCIYCVPPTLLLTTIDRLSRSDLALDSILDPSQIDPLTSSFIRGNFCGG